MNYFIAKLKWVEPKPGTDQVKKVSKNYLIQDTGITECEAKLKSWIPANYQDAEVQEIKKTKIESVVLDNTCEVYWIVRSQIEIEDKPKVYIDIYNGVHIEEVVKKTKTTSGLAEVVSIQRITIEIEDELINK